MAQIRNRFKVLLAEKEFQDGRSYTYDEIREATGVSPNTLSSYATNSVSRFDGNTLIKLCDWLGCELSDLLEYPPEIGQRDSLMLAVPA